MIRKLRAPGTARILRARGLTIDRARKLRAPWIGKPRARWKRAVPGILANEWRPSNKFSFAVESRRIMETLWSKSLIEALLKLDYEELRMDLPPQVLSREIYRGILYRRAWAQPKRHSGARPCKSPRRHRRCTLRSAPRA